jgi:hypothetical protein
MTCLFEVSGREFRGIVIVEDIFSKRHDSCLGSATSQTARRPGDMRVYSCLPPLAQGCQKGLGRQPRLATLRGEELCVRCAQKHSDLQ